MAAIEIVGRDGLFIKTSLAFCLGFGTGEREGREGGGTLTVNEDG